jgi:hypothetical protein
VGTPDVVSEILRVAAQGAGSAASAAGGAAAEALIAALRERLGGAEGDLAALDAFLGNPGDAAGAAAVRAVLERNMAADPGFGLRLKSLAEAAAAPQHQTIAGSVVIGSGARVGRSQISLGPLTVNNTWQGRSLLAALAVVLVILLAMAGYGGARLFADDDPDGGPGASGPGGSKPPATDSVRPTRRTADPLPPTQKTVDAILPDRAAMEGTLFEDPPGGTFPDGERSGYEGTVCADYPAGCGQRVRAAAAAGYSPDEISGGWHAELDVLAHASEGDARKTFDALKGAFEDKAAAGEPADDTTVFVSDPSAYTPPEHTQPGDELVSYRVEWEGEDIGVLCLIRRGPYVALVKQEKDDAQAALEDDMQTRLNTLLLRRIDEALSGDTPHTALRDIQGA